MDNNIYNLLLNTAKTSNINKKVSAVLIKGHKILSRPKTNAEEPTFQSADSYNLHAEANAIIGYYGNDLKFDHSMGAWYLLPKRYKKGKRRRIANRL